MASQSKLSAHARNIPAPRQYAEPENIVVTSKTSADTTMRLKIKPISLMVFALFAQPLFTSVAFAQQAEAQDLLVLISSNELASSVLNNEVSEASTQQTAQLKKKALQAKEADEINSTSTTSIVKRGPATSKIILADASVKEIDSTNKQNTAPAITEIPSNSRQYGITKKTLLAAEVTDASPVGTSAGAKESAKEAAKDKGKNDLPLNLELKEITVKAKRFLQVGPMPGLGLTKEEIPGNVQSLTVKQIKESHSLSIADLMNTQLQSVSVNDYQGNPFQMDVNYRGFTASPQLGTAQGISVFLDGIRVNEPFGDVVNWDMIPMNALAGLEVFPGSNPLFGLGTLGGALSMRTKSGFDNPGVDVEVLAGSYGRKQLQLSGGTNNGVIAGFLSGNFFMEDGWRDNSPSKVNQVFGKAEWQNEVAQMSFSGLYAGNKLTGNGLLPEQMADQNRSQVYTSPDVSKNDLLQFQLSGIFNVSDTFNVTGMVYHRKSNRKSKTTDVNENFDGYATPANRAAGKQVLQGFSDINNDGLPDYNVFPLNVAAGPDGRALDVNGIASGDPGFDINNLAIGTNFYNTVVAGQDTFVANDGSGTIVPRWVLDPRAGDVGAIFDTINPYNGDGGTYNATLPNSYYQQALDQWKNKITRQTLTGGIDTTVSGPPFPGVDENGSAIQNSAYYFPWLNAGVVDFAYFTNAAGFLNKLTTLQSINDALRDPNIAILDRPDGTGLVAGLVALDQYGNISPINRDGASPDSVGNTGIGTGYIPGTPTALITETAIDQLSTGGSLQLNWNLEQHKFMVGASIDKAEAQYASLQYLGLLDANRNGAASPDELGYEYYARDKAHALSLNDFDGNSVTKSLYTSETWSPTKSVNITAAARFNHTTINNYLAVNSQTNRDLTSYLNLLDAFALCNGSDTNGDGVVDAENCPTGIPDANLPDQATLLQNFGVFDPGEKEKFKYRSFNPALGATWQVDETLNVYVNWNRGARTPTVIELGCAYDDSPVALPGTNPVQYVPRSLAQRRTCNLPSTLSGDPYLKQVRSTTYEIGARGYLTSDIEWNAAVYRTNLKDDIYFVSVNPSQSFFQNIGDTRRQGLEMGLKGKVGKASFGLNYSLTDATFQSAFRLDSPNNSSAGTNELENRAAYVNGLPVREVDYQKIKVKPGNRMPGIPLHNLNANVSYDLTDKWTVGLNAVMHSGAFVRGNENNKHKAGALAPIQTTCFIAGIEAPCDVPRADAREGTTAGFTLFNFQTRYKLDKGLTLGLQVNNLFDKEYASAGRLGLNAFSPSVNGAIGASGFNYNSSEWQGTSFLGLGAPRSAYVTLTYEFNPSGK